MIKKFDPPKGLVQKNMMKKFWSPKNWLLKTINFGGNKWINLIRVASWFSGWTFWAIYNPIYVIH